MLGLTGLYLKAHQTLAVPANSIFGEVSFSHKGFTNPFVEIGQIKPDPISIAAQMTQFTIPDEITSLHFDK